MFPKHAFTKVHINYQISLFPFCHIQMCNLSRDLTIYHFKHQNQTLITAFRHLKSWVPLGEIQQIISSQSIASNRLLKL